MRNIKAIINELEELTNDLTEDELVDEYDLGIEAEPEKFSITAQLDAKTKVSRALDVFIQALNDFKNAIAPNVDLVEDSLLMTSVEAIDQEIANIENVLGDKDTDYDAEIEDDEDDSEDEVDEPSENDEENDEEEGEDTNFDDEASLDLYGQE